MVPHTGMPVRRGATGGRWAAKRGAEQPGTGGRAREKLPPRLVWSDAGPWIWQRDQLAGNSWAAFLARQPNQPQQARIANQAGVAFMARPDRRKGGASGEEEWVELQRRRERTRNFVCVSDSLPGGPH